MMNDTGAIYEVDSLSFLKDEPLFFGLPRMQAAGAFAGGGLCLLYTMIFAGIGTAIVVGIIAYLGLMITLRHLCKRCPYWLHLVTSQRRFPTIYTGA